MVKKLLNALFTPPAKIASSRSPQSSKLQLPKHPDTTIKLIRTNRKKTIAFQIINNQIRVTAPKRLALYRIQQLLIKRSKWISQQLQQQASQPKIDPKQYVDGTQISYLGKRYRLNIITSSTKGSRARLKAGQLIVELSNAQESSDATKTVVGQWYQQRAEERLPKIVAKLSKEIGVDYGDIEIRYFKSRWGSCRADGRLQFNWRLMMAPPQIIEYVVVHELCHRIHLNHSRMFWREVEQQMSDYKQNRKWLKARGHLLAL